MRTPFVRPALLRTVALLSPVLALGLAAGSGPAEAQDPVERGRYLANEVAMCVECHSPRGAEGEILDSRRFEGGRVPFDSPFTATEWAFRAPALVGLPGYSDEDAMRLLTQGFTKSGTAPRGPMPPFRLEAEDARAVIAYLRSLR